MRSSIVVDNNNPQNKNCWTNKFSFYSRIFTICLGSISAGITLSYYQVLLSLYRFENPQNQQIKKWQYDIIGSIVVFVGFIASFVTYKLQHLSRRYILMLGPFIGIVGHVISIFSFVYKGSYYLFNIPLIVVGRVFEGTMLGIFVTYCLVLINQYSPNNLRLNCICIQQIFFHIGSFIASFIYPVLILNFNLSRDMINITVYCISIAIMLLQIILLKFVFKQESPIYLIQNNRQSEARSIIQSMYDFEIIDEKLLECKYEAGINENSFYDEYDKKTIFKKSMILGVYVVLLKQLVGLNFIIVVPPFKFKQLCYQQIFLTSLPNLCQIFGVSLLFIISNIERLRRFTYYSKRKPLIQLGTLFSTIFIIVIVVLKLIGYFNESLFDTKFVMYIIQNPFIFLYGFILAPIIWLYLCQMFKIKQLHICIAINWLITFVNDTSAHFLSKLKMSQIFIPFFYLLFSITFLVLNKWYLIQTKNQSYLQVVRWVDSFKVNPFSKQQQNVASVRWIRGSSIN